MRVWLALATAAMLGTSPAQAADFSAISGVWAADCSGPGVTIAANGKATFAIDGHAAKGDVEASGPNFSVVAEDGRSKRLFDIFPAKGGLKLGYFSGHDGLAEVKIAGTTLKAQGKPVTLKKCGEAPSGPIPIGKGKVVMTDGVGFRALAPDDLFGSWGDVKETGAAPTDPFEWTCPGHGIGEKADRYKFGTALSAALPDGTDATLSGTVAFARDRKGKPYRVGRGVIVSLSQVAPLTGEPVMADAETIAFSAAGIDYRLKRFHILKWTYAADGRRINLDPTKTIEPAFFIYALSYRDQDRSHTDYLVKCLG